VVVFLIAVTLSMKGLFLVLLLHGPSILQYFVTAFHHLLIRDTVINPTLSGMHDLSLKWKGTKPKDNTETVKQLLKLGWSSCAWNTAVFGKLGNKSAKQSGTAAIDTSDVKECARSRGLLKLPSNEIDQLSRITITVDDIVDCQALTASNETLRSYDIVAACPGNATVFAYLCRTAHVDIISIDFSRHLPFSLIKKQVLQCLTCSKMLQRNYPGFSVVGPSSPARDSLRDTIQSAAYR
jgi:hypothetical protein